MRPSVVIDGRPSEITTREYRKGEAAVTRAMHGAASDLKLAWRAQIQGAGLGRKLANTIRHEGYPKGAKSLRAAAMVWSKAPHIVSAYDQGVMISAYNGQWLAIPKEHAGRGRGGRRITPEEWEKSRGVKLEFVPRGPTLALLVANDVRFNKRGHVRKKGGRRRKKDGILSGAQGAIIFTLVQQVSLRKRLDLARDVRQAEASIPGRITANWPD